MDKDRLVAIDIGNTTVEFAFMVDGKVMNKFFTNSKPMNLNDIEFGLNSKEVYSFRNSPVMISSVVPSNNIILKEFMLSRFSAKVFIIDANSFDLIVGVRKRNINEVGMDILCKSAWGISNNHTNFLVLDVGTATVLQYVSEGYLDKVAITIGFSAIYGSLNQMTELLPLLTPQPVDNLLGENTLEAIYGGTYWGYIGILSSWVKKAKEEIGNCDIYLTGGLSSMIINKLDFETIHDHNIIFKGIWAIYKRNISFINKVGV